MKKTSVNLPNLSALSAIIVLALVTTGCGTPPPATTNTDSTNSVPATADTSAPATDQINTPTNSASNNENVAATADTKFKDGTYSAQGEYESPAGNETIGVTVTLKDDIIVDAKVKMEATVKRSVVMQEDFIANFKPQVIGKKIDSIHLTKISGSSLTPEGFNDALKKIQAQAK